MAVLVTEGKVHPKLKNRSSWRGFMLILAFLTLISLLGRSSYGETSLALADALQNHKIADKSATCENTQDSFDSNKDRPVKIWKKYILDCLHFKKNYFVENKNIFMTMVLVGITSHKLQYRLQSLAPPFVL